MISKYFLQIWTIVIILSFIPISNIVIKPTIEFCLFILMSSFIFYIIELFVNKISHKKNISFNQISIPKFEYILLIIFILLFIINAIFSHFKFPILSLLGIDSVRYNEYGIKGLQGLTNAIWLTLLTLIYFNKIYFNKTNNIIFYILLLYPILLISRQLIVSLTIQLLFIWLIHSHIPRLKKVSKLFIFSLLGIIIFGILGNIRVAADGIDPTELLKSLLDPTEFGMFLPSIILWFYMYSVTPLSNLLLNLSHSQESGMLSDYFSAILPSPIRKAIYGDNGFDGYSNIVLVNDNLNMATAYIAPYLSSGWLGIYIHSLILGLFLFFTKLIYKKNIYFYMTYFVIIQVFILSIFSNVLFYLPIIFQYVIFLILGIFYEITTRSPSD